MADVSTFLKQTLKGPDTESTHKMLMEYWNDNLEKVHIKCPEIDQPDILKLYSKKEVWTLYYFMGGEKPPQAVDEETIDVW